MRSSIPSVLILCLLCAYPAASISPWFSAAFNDLKFTLYRYGHCLDGLQPLNGYNLTETDYLINQIKVFLDQGQYDNEQLANVSTLMDSICRPNIDTDYAISVHIDVNKFSNGHPAGKENRCNAIDDALDSMYYVLRRSAVNHLEPLDFSIIQFYPNETDRSATYNLTDLINTSWIKSETVLEHVCAITNATKDYIQSRSRKATAQSRAEPAARTRVVESLMDYLNRLMDPILGLQKRLYWESANRIGQFQSRISSGLGSIRSGIGSGVDRTRQRLFGSRNNSTGSQLNATSPSQSALNSGAGSGGAGTLISTSTSTSVSSSSTSPSNQAPTASTARPSTTLAPGALVSAGGAAKPAA